LKNSFKLQLRIDLVKMNVEVGNDLVLEPPHLHGCHVGRKGCSLRILCSRPGLTVLFVLEVIASGVAEEREVLLGLDRGGGWRL
jgi:hypothetical protein